MSYKFRVTTILFLILIISLLLLTLLTEIAYAQLLIPFGGRLTVMLPTPIVPCTAPPGAFLITVVGIRGGSFLLMPTTRRFLYAIPQPRIGPFVLGLAAGPPTPCTAVVPPATVPAPIGIGIPVLMIGSSRL